MIDSLALALIVGGGTAMVALLLSMTQHARLARRLAQASLGLALGTVPLAIASDLARLSSAAGTHSKAELFGNAIAHTLNYGALVLPSAALAGLALRRANANRLR